VIALYINEIVQWCALIALAYALHELTAALRAIADATTKRDWVSRSAELRTLSSEQIGEVGRLAGDSRARDAGPHQDEP
jgi:hypothetical protein